MNFSRQAFIQQLNACSLRHLGSYSRFPQPLLDTYGTLEPVDIPAMESVFKQLYDDPRVQILGQHFGSLINAYGCAQKDLDKAIEVFDSIPSYGPALADAVVFEALLNALLAHRRTDLMPEYN